MNFTKCWSTPYLTPDAVWLGYDNYGNHFYYEKVHKFIVMLEHNKTSAQAQWKLVQLPQHIVAELAALQLEGSV